MRFSILIPAYKGKYIHDAIISCLSQTYSDFEVVVVNDASPEDLDSIINNINDSRIKYFVNSKGCGAINVIDNWNKCLNYAEGQYVICMGDDDMLLPHCLEEYNKLINKYPGLGVYHAWTILIDEKGQPFGMQHARPEWEGPASFAWHRWNGRNKQFIGDFCFNATELKSQGGFYKLPLAWGTDDITTLRAAIKGGIANTPVPCFMYRENHHTITRTGNYKIKLEATLLEMSWYQSNLNLLNDNFSVPEELCQYKNHFIQVESLFHHLLKEQIKIHFTKNTKTYLYLVLREDPLSIFYWMCHNKDIRLTKLMVMKCFIKSIFKKTLSNHKI